MPSAQAGVKRKRRTDGPNHPDRKKKTKPRFKRMKPSAYHSSSEDEADLASGANSTDIGIRLPKDEVEKKKAENGRESVSASVAGEGSRGIPSSQEGDSELEGADDNEQGVQLPNLQDEEEEADEFDVADAPSDEEDDDEEDESGSDEQHDETGINGNGNRRQIKKRNDPAAFAASMSAILSSKLTSSKRADPVLSRSVAAASNAEQRADMKLEAKARRKLTHDKKALQDRGHIRDVMGVESSEISAAAVAEQEKRLRKMAQRGVVKLFNAVRAAQVRGEEARGAMQKIPGEVVGIDKRAERVNELSKQGFLDLLTKGS